MEPRRRNVLPSVRLLSSRLLAIALGALAVALPATLDRHLSRQGSRPRHEGLHPLRSRRRKGRSALRRRDRRASSRASRPKQDLILARVHSEAIEKTGIIAGMSGSPVYVDGRLVGALAYGWPFSREPICGITPIQSMLDIRKAPAAPPVPIGGTATRASRVHVDLRRPRLRDGLTALLTPLRSEAAERGARRRFRSRCRSPARRRDGSLFGRVAEAAGWLVAPSGASARRRRALRRGRVGRRWRPPRAGLRRRRGPSLRATWSSRRRAR